MASTQFVITLADPAAWLGWQFTGETMHPTKPAVRGRVVGVCVAIDGTNIVLRRADGGHDLVPMHETILMSAPRAEWAIHLDKSESI